MRRRTNHVPSYRLHKASGQAVVVINGHTRYLGKHGSKSSREAYARAIAEWSAQGSAAVPTDSHLGTVLREPPDHLCGVGIGRGVSVGRRHDGHPVQRWMASDVAVELDPAGNFKPSKKKRTERIDGIMALSRAQVDPDTDSVCENRGLIPI